MQVHGQPDRVSLHEARDNYRLSMPSILERWHQCITRTPARMRRHGDIRNLSTSHTAERANRATRRSWR